MKLNYIEQGVASAPTIILIHGMFGSLSNLGMLGRALVDRYRVISVDLRNHGDSPHEQKMDIPTMAMDIVELMDDLSLDSATLIGHSLGGKIAMQVALNTPARVAALVVADIAPVTYSGGQDQALAGLVALSLGSVESRGAADKILSEYIELPSTRAFLLKNLARDGQGKLSLKLNISSIKQNYSTTLIAAPTGVLYSGPTLFLKGESSAYIQDKHRPIIEQMFPQVQLQVVANAGHWLHAEQPQVVNSLITDFLGENHLING
jgi:esterase